MSRIKVPGLGIYVTTAVLVLAFALSWHFFRRMDPYESLMPGSEAFGSIPFQLSDVDVRNRSNGRPVWQLHASSLTISADHRSIAADGLSSGIFYRNSKPILLFAASHVVSTTPVFYMLPVVTADGSVDIWSTANNLKFPIAVHVSTKHIEWNESTGIARCTGPVSFSASNLGNGFATGLIYDALHKDLLFGQISATSDLKLADDPIPALPASASPAPAASTTTAAVASSGDNNNVSYKASDGFWDENSQVLTVKGPITFFQGKAKVDMIGATFDEKSDTAVSSSPLKFTDTDTTVTGDHGSIDFTTHIAILSGHITMIVLPKPTDQQKDAQAKKPTTILCDQINYDYKAKKAHTTGEVTIKQTGRVVTADDGQYDVTLKVIDLTGDVVGKSTDGKLIKSPHAKVSVDPADEWMQLDGPITGYASVPSEDNPLADAPTGVPEEKTTNQAPAPIPSGAKPTGQ